MNSLEEIIQALTHRTTKRDVLIEYATTTSQRQILKDARQIANKLSDITRRCPQCGTDGRYQTSCPNCGKERSG